MRARQARPPRRRARQLGDGGRRRDAVEQRLEDGQAGAHDGHADVDGRPDLGARVRGHPAARHEAQDDFDEAGDDDAAWARILASGQVQTPDIYR